MNFAGAKSDTSHFAGAKSDTSHFAYFEVRNWTFRISHISQVRNRTLRSFAGAKPDTPQVSPPDTHAARHSQRVSGGGACERAPRPPPAVRVGGLSTGGPDEPCKIPCPFMLQDERRRGPSAGAARARAREISKGKSPLHQARRGDDTCPGARGSRGVWGNLAALCCRKSSRPRSS